MDTPTSMRASKCTSLQKPALSWVETSLQYKTFMQTSNSPIDASFSPYLKPQEPKPACREEVGGNIDDSEISIFDANKYFNETNDLKESNPSLEFEADQCHLAAVQNLRLSSVSSIDGYGRNYRVQSFQATPTASSEASWNSQTGLLSNPSSSVAVSLRNLHPSYEKKRSSAGYRKWFFRRKCPCSGQKSVQVEEAMSEPKPSGVPEAKSTNSIFYPERQSPNSLERIAEKVQTSSAPKSSINKFVEERREKVIPSHQNASPRNHFSPSITRNPCLLGQPRPFADNSTGGFSFPILNPSSQGKLILNGLPSRSSASNLEDPPRESLEIFQPLDELILKKSTDQVQQPIPNHCGNVERIRRGFGFLGSPISRVTATDDDAASDASSDLFEIESFSTPTTLYPMCRRRDSLDEASTFNSRRLAAGNGIVQLYGRRSVDEPMTPSIAPTECYEPNEASIDWSVTTAEGFDKASVTNFSIAPSEVEEFGTHNGHAGGAAEVVKRKGNRLLLMSCRHDKAVNVGPNPVKCAAADARPFPFVSTTGHVSSRTPSSNKPPLARSRSARLSLTFVT